MRVEIDDLPSGIRQITLIGRLDVEGVSAIDDRFSFIVTTDTAPVLVDMAQVDFIASIGMRMLLMNAKALNRRGGKLVLYRPPLLVGEALATAGIDMLIPVHDDFDAACTDLLQARSAAV